MFGNEDAANCLLPMGITSENVAERFHISREKQDMFATESHKYWFKFCICAIFFNINMIYSCLCWIRRGSITFFVCESGLIFYLIVYHIIITVKMVCDYDHHHYKADFILIKTYTCVYSLLIELDASLLLGVQQQQMRWALFHVKLFQRSHAWRSSFNNNNIKNKPTGTSSCLFSESVFERVSLVSGYCNSCS